MTLQELQAMIKEEFSHFINEQPGAGAPGMPPAPPAPGAPGIDVAPGDVDAMEPPSGGPEGAEAQLQAIFQMLKTYFEGGEEGMEPDMDAMDAAADDMGDVGPGPELQIDPADAPGDDIELDTGGEEEEEEETVDEAYGEKTGGNAASTSGKYGGAYGASGEDKGPAQLHEQSISRMQKLANIRK